MYEDIAIGEIDKKLLDNEGLVWATLYKYYPMEVNDEDIFWFGMTGLWKAVITYDPSKGFEFSTYACRCIGNAVNAEVLRRSRREKPMASLEGIVEKTEVRADSSMFLRGDVNIKWYDRRGLFERLTPRQRTILEHREKGYSFRECGEAVGIGHSRAQQEIQKIQAFALDYIG